MRKLFEEVRMVSHWHTNPHSGWRALGCLRGDAVAAIKTLSLLCSRTAISSRCRPYGAALTEAWQNPSVLLSSEKVSYTAVALLFTDLFSTLARDDAHSTAPLFPTLNEIRAMARKRAREEISDLTRNRHSRRWRQQQQQHTVAPGHSSEW